MTLPQATNMTNTDERLLARTDKQSSVFPETARRPRRADRICPGGFIKNVRSLSIDRVVVRANWIDALDYVTPRGARALNAYAGKESPFAKIGRQTITVESIEVPPAFVDAFDVRRKSGRSRLEQ